jgi:hypothetical protein
MWPTFDRSFALTPALVVFRRCGFGLCLCHAFGLHTLRILKDVASVTAKQATANDLGDGEEMCFQYAASTNQTACNMPPVMKKTPSSTGESSIGLCPSVPLQCCRHGQQIRPCSFTPASRHSTAVRSETISVSCVAAVGRGSDGGARRLNVAEWMDSMQVRTPETPVTRQKAGGCDQVQPGNSKCMYRGTGRAACRWTMAQ